MSESRRPPRNRFSSCCGKPFAETTLWPRRCSECGNEFWDNPTPVAIVLQPVIREDDRVGIIVVRRAIAPCIGQLALPGGYQEIEHWSEAGAREFREECAENIPASRLRPFQPYPFASSTNHRQTMFFCLAPAIRVQDLHPFVPNHEVSERKIVFEPVECCFNTHTEAIKAFFHSYMRAPAPYTSSPAS